MRLCHIRLTLALALADCINTVYLFFFRGASMKCPTCKTVHLVMSERQGVEIDYCSSMSRCLVG